MGLGRLMCLSWTDRVIHSRWILFISARLVHPQMDNMRDRHDRCIRAAVVSVSWLYVLNVHVCCADCNDSCE